MELAGGYHNFKSKWSAGSVVAAAAAAMAPYFIAIDTT